MAMVVAGEAAGLWARMAAGLRARATIRPRSRRQESPVRDGRSRSAPAGSGALVSPDGPVEALGRPVLAVRYEAGRFVEYQRVEDYWGKHLAVNRGRDNFDVQRHEYFRDATNETEDLPSGPTRTLHEIVERHLGYAAARKALDIMVVDEARAATAGLFPLHRNDVAAAVPRFVAERIGPDQADREVPADLPRVDFFHWVLVDLPPGLHEIAEGEFSRGFTPRGKPGPATLRFSLAPENAPR